MKARVIDEQIKVYSSMDDPISIATVSKGMEVEFGGVKRQAGKTWYRVTLATGQQAFIPGESHIFAVREGALMQEKVDVHAEPSAESLVKQQLTRNTHMNILEVVTEGEQRWVRVRDMNGNEGFIDGETRIKVVQQKTKALARKNLLTAAMWLIIGGIFTFSNAATVSGSGFRLLGLGALLFGAGMLVWGLYQYFTATS